MCIFLRLCNHNFQNQIQIEDTAPSNSNCCFRHPSFPLVKYSLAVSICHCNHSVFQDYRSHDIYCFYRSWIAVNAGRSFSFIRVWFSHPIRSSFSWRFQVLDYFLPRVTAYWPVWCFQYPVHLIFILITISPSAFLWYTSLWTLIFYVLPFFHLFILFLNLTLLFLKTYFPFP